MKFLWVDTETTGLDEDVHRPFEIAFIYLNNRKEENGRVSHIECERDFYLNPLDIEGVKYSEDAGKVHGYSEEKIRELPPAKEIVPKLVTFFEDVLNHFGTGKTEKPFLCGYNVGFDYKMIKKLLEDFGYNINDYVQNHFMDVFEQVKTAGNMRCRSVQTLEGTFC